MSHALLQKLVRQSEAEGVTLAEVISKALTASELEDVQKELTEELNEGYESICDFMSEVDVPTLEEMMESESANDVDLARALN